jgi:hypothetical protein
MMPVMPLIVRRFLRRAFCGLLFVLSCQAFGEQTWTEIRSPHFRVITDASGKDGRRIANQFEQMRHVLSERFPNGRLEGSAPLTIFAVSDGYVFGKLDPRTSKMSSGNVARRAAVSYSR